MKEIEIRERDNKRGEIKRRRRRIKRNIKEKMPGEVEKEKRRKLYQRR